MDNRGKWSRLAAPSAALLLAVAFHAAMARGAGVSTDSIIFLDAAGNLASKGSLWVTVYGQDIPLTHFPPFYPVLLAGAGTLLGMSMEAAARLLGALAFGANAFLCGVLARRFGASRRTAVYAASLFACSEYAIAVHAKVLTEPLFLTFVFGTLLCAARYLETERWRFLWMAGCLAALACLQRYAGLALVASTALALAFAGKRSGFKRRVLSAAAFSAAALLPLALWMVRNMALGGSAAHRRLAFHPLDVPHLRQLVRSVMFVFLPDAALERLKTADFAVLASAAVAAAFLAGSLAFILWRRYGRVLRGVPGWVFERAFSPSAFPAASFLLVYPAFLAVSISFADYTTPLSYRIMLPEFAVAVPFLAWLLSDAAVSAGRGPRRVLRFSAALFLAFYVVRAVPLLAGIHRDGLEYSSVAWRDSKLVEFVRALPPGVPVYTNGQAGIQYQTGRTAKRIPPAYLDGRPNPALAAELEEMSGILRGKRGVVVFFNTVPSSLLPTPVELSERLGLKTILKAPDGVALAPEASEEAARGGKP